MVRFHRRWEQGQQATPFRRLREKRWNRTAFWRYALLLVLILIIFKMLNSI